MLQNMCRLCAGPTDDQKALNLFMKSTEKLLVHLRLLTGVLLTASVDLPDLICPNCQRNLKRFMGFRKRCLSSQKKFQQLQEERCEAIPPDAPTAATRVMCIRRSGRIQPKEDDDEEVLIKVEQLSEERVNREDEGIDRLDTSNMLEASSSASSSDHEQKISLNSDENDLYVPPAAPKRRGRRAADKSSQEKRPKPTLPVFFCDQCGHNIIGKTSFDRHLRKHSGIRPFQCETCPARFLSAGELKGHQVMHTGDRNFPCRYCDRSYVNYSGRLRHERTHTNERPFVCAQCGKSFTNAYILKNHMLIHTGERLFRCDLCQRSFSRPTHLKTHYRSNTHKQNVEKSKEEAKQETNPLTFTVEVPLLVTQEQNLDITLA